MENNSTSGWDSISGFDKQREAVGSEMTTQSNNHSISETFANTNVKYFAVALYTATFVAGAIGNAVLLFVVTRYREVRRNSVANYYIMNLAIADELFIWTLPLFCHATYTSKWVFGNPTCKIAFVLKESNKFASIFSLVALSGDRVLASYPSLRRLRSITVGKGTCVVIWIFSLVMSTPYFLYSYSVQLSGSDDYTCRINWPSNDFLYHLRVWTFIQLAMGLVVPFCSIVVSYCLLVVRFRQVTRARSKERVKKPWRKLSLTVIVIVAAFLICHVPYYILDVFSLSKVELVESSRLANTLYLPTLSEWNVFVYCNAIAQVLVFMSSCCNPVLYGIFNENFRHLYQRILCCKAPTAVITSSIPKPESMQDQVELDPLVRANREEENNKTQSHKTKNKPNSNDGHEEKDLNFANNHCEGVNEVSREKVSKNHHSGDVDGKTMIIDGKCMIEINGKRMIKVDEKHMIEVYGKHMIEVDGKHMIEVVDGNHVIDVDGTRMTEVVDGKCMLEVNSGNRMLEVELESGNENGTENARELARRTSAGLDRKANTTTHSNGGMDHQINGDLTNEEGVYMETEL